MSNRALQCEGTVAGLLVYKDAAAEPALRFYNDEVAFKWIEGKGGKDFHNFQALESAAEALFD